MKKLLQILAFVFLPALMATKTDPFATVPEKDHAVLEAGIKRFAADEIKLNFADLYDFQEQDISMRRDLGLPDNGPLIDRSTFVERMKSAIEDGNSPFLKTFELREIIPVKGHYLIHACSKAQRENFRYLGIIQFEAFIQDEKVHFGTWSFVYNSPHSCEQKEDSPM